MKTLFDKATRNEIIGRIHSLNDASKAGWGKMNVHQMINHCILAEEMLVGRETYQRAFIGRILGKMILKKMLKDETPMQKNAPTHAKLKIKELGGDISSEKNKWISMINEYENFSKPDFVHWFFGKMTKEQIGQLAYKHTDHHLRQFNS